MSAAMRLTNLHDEGLTRRELELAGIISAYNDVTEQLKVAHERLGREVARLHEELREKNEELQRRQRLAALGEMAAGLAHEIRNPLGGIALYASYLERELTGQPSAATAAKIFHGVRSLEHLVGEILDFAQEDRIEPRRYRLDALLRDVEDSVARALLQTGVDLRVNHDCNSDWVWCDPPRLQRALTNLVINAIDASGRGGCVTLTAHGGADGVQVEVRDTGPGIPEAMRQRIFHPFVTTKASGTGLGLAICHRIIEAHHGTIRAGNHPEGGARFIVRLPPESESSKEAYQAKA